MKGSLHTDELLGAVVAARSGLRTERRISHVYALDVPAYPKTLILTDAAINIAPTLEQKRDICQNAIDLLHLLGVAEPLVAILAAVETVNPAMQATLDAAALTMMAARGQITGAKVDGPLAFDNAISFDAARIKEIVSPVAGQADILVVPDLEAGNMLAKQLIYLAGADAAGLVLGARTPIILTSRRTRRRSGSPPPRSPSWRPCAARPGSSRHERLYSPDFQCRLFDDQARSVRHRSERPAPHRQRRHRSAPCPLTLQIAEDGGDRYSAAGSRHG